jgi:tagatose 6-phosphate kinase
LNPSVDTEWHVDNVRWEEKNNLASEHRWAGGKGVNVARWLTYLGAKPLLLLPLGGATGRQVARDLKAEGIAARIIPIKGETRVNVIVTTQRQGQLRFNPPGPEISKREWSRILAAVRSQLPRAGCLVLSGSLPRGLPASTYASLIKLANRHNILVYLDCDGPALASALKHRPFMVKPNESELLAWAKDAGLKAGRSERDIRRLALAMARVTRRWVVVSRGGKAALMVHGSPKEEFWANPLCVVSQTTVGAGDAMLAGMVAGFGCMIPNEAWLRYGLCVGTIATQRRPSTLLKSPGLRE